MKIVCGSCQAKYSIADEKVAGKVFKIRCKKCSEVIVVRGDQEGAAPAVNSNGHEQAEANADAIWHAVIDGEQAGPFTAEQLGDMVRSGQLGWEAYVWSEGFENWQPMREVPQLVAALGGSREQQREQQEAITATSQPVQVAAQPSMGADPFAEEAPVAYAKVAGGHGGGGGHAVVSRAVITNANPSPSFDPSPKVQVSAPNPRVSNEQALTGARNENSVLFSLKNLQALATGSSTPAASPSTRPGYAGGEGSGLIDIRALATTTGVADATKNGSEKDALLSLGSAQAGAFGALGSPMLAAPDKSDDDSGRKGLVLAIVGGFALLAAAGVAIAFIMKPQAGPAPVINPAPMVQAPVGAVPPVAPTNIRPNEPAPAAAAASNEAPSEGELAARRAAEANARSSDPNDDRHNAAHNGRHVATAPEKPGPAAAPEPAPKPEAAPTKPARKGNASIDDLLNDAISGGGKGNSAGGGKEPAADSNLPEKPSREDVLSAMKAVSDQVKACGNGQSGVAFANVTVAGKTGRVSNVDVTGMTGEVGSCIARAVRKASFPKFKANNFEVKFPFRL